MMKYLLTLTAAAALLAAGCRVIPSGPAPEPASAGLTASARELGAAMLSAIRDRDYAAFCALAPDQLKKQTDEAAFKAAGDRFRDEYGELADFEFVTFLDAPEVADGVWKVGFVRMDSSGHPVRREVLFRAVAAEIDGKPELLSFGFF